MHKEQGRAVCAAEAERLHLWAEGQQTPPGIAAMEMYPSGTYFTNAIPPLNEPVLQSWSLLNHTCIQLT